MKTKHLLLSALFVFAGAMARAEERRVLKLKDYEPLLLSTLEEAIHEVDHIHDGIVDKLVIVATRGSRNPFRQLAYLIDSSSLEYHYLDLNILARRNSADSLEEAIWYSFSDCEIGFQSKPKRYGNSHPAGQPIGTVVYFYGCTSEDGVSKIRPFAFYMDDLNLAKKRPLEAGHSELVTVGNMERVFKNKFETTNIISKGREYLDKNKFENVAISSVKKYDKGFFVDMKVSIDSTQLSFKRCKLSLYFKPEPRRGYMAYLRKCISEDGMFAINGFHFYEDDLINSVENLREK